MRYTIYKTINTINEKYYIGMHRTNDPYDSYLGSGVSLNKAIKKYGKENFKKEVLYIFETEKEMQDKEKEIVNDDFVKNKQTYNMTKGGEGSWSHIDSSGENNPMHKSKGRSWKDGKTQKEIDFINVSKASKGEANGMYGKTHSDEAKSKIIAANKEWLKTPEGKAAMKKRGEECSKRMKGKPKSEEQKKKMSESAKERFKNMPIIECPHCGKEGKGNAMKQWHFNNCKFKK